MVINEAAYLVAERLLEEFENFHFHLHVIVALDPLLAEIGQVVGDNDLTLAVHEISDPSDRSALFAVYDLVVRLRPGLTLADWSVSIPSRSGYVV